MGCASGGGVLAKGLFPGSGGGRDGFLGMLVELASETEMAGLVLEEGGGGGGRFLAGGSLWMTG